MRASRHVVVVTRGRSETKRWRSALEIGSAKEAADGYSWHVFDCLPGSLIARIKQGIVQDRHECAERLNAFLGDMPFIGPRAIDDPEITLIAHRDRCNVIRQFVVNHLVPDGQVKPAELGDVRSIRRLRQVVLIDPRTTRVLWWVLMATVFFAVAGPLAEFFAARGAQGSEPATGWLLLKAFSLAIAGVLGLAFAVLMTEEGQQKLRIRSLSDSRLADTFRNAVEGEASKKRPLRWPIPTRTLDIRGRPERASALIEIAKAVRQPRGHENLYDVELWERHIAVGPADPSSVPPSLRHLAEKQGRHHVFADNRARYRARVKFSANNERAASTTLDDWFIRYGTKLGLIDVNPVHPDNLWEPRYIDEYGRDHLRYEYHFRPAPDKVYELELTVYGGYGESDRGSHTHLRTDTYYWRVRETLDVSGYLQAGFVASPPVVSFRQGALPRVSTGDANELRTIGGLKCDCAGMNPQDFESFDVPITQLNDGVYSWEIEGIRDGGVLEFKFTLTKKPIPPRPPAGIADEIV